MNNNYLMFKSGNKNVVPTIFFSYFHFFFWWGVWEYFLAKSFTFMLEFWLLFGYPTCAGIYTRLIREPVFGTFQYRCARVGRVRVFIATRNIWILDPDFSKYSGTRLLVRYPTSNRNPKHNYLINIVFRRNPVKNWSLRVCLRFAWISITAHVISIIRSFS